ncbi:YppF family protein [Pontibacillus salicampi]|uniref:YppF family protein n=1 Tax=Pontibacillus salicampi TaxID=1449801 RepID=A0ABV6LQX6_9BACI
MHLEKLSEAYQREKGHEPETANQLLDYCQHLYVNGTLDSQSYRSLFQLLHEKGAQSSHKETQTQPV